MFLSDAQLEIDSNSKIYMLFNNLEYKKKRTYRVIVHFQNGQGFGSGFFINESSFLTCFHVIFGTELKNIREDEQFIATAGTNEHLKLENFFRSKVTKIEVELDDNSRVEARLQSFDEKYDIILLKVATGEKEVNICDLEFAPKLNHWDHLSFVGFPTHHDYSLDKAPLAVHEGILSTFVETVIGGDKYEHLQINTINLGGNSGAPLFLRKSKKVVAIVNGNMNWGRDDLAAVGNPLANVSKVSLRVPLSIAYATKIGLIKNKTEIFENFISPRNDIFEKIKIFKNRLRTFMKK